MAAGAFFDVTIQGKWGHGAYPHLAIDPIPITAELIGLLQTIVSRMISPNDSAVFSITKVHSGDAYNVIPDSPGLSGTVYRTFSMELADKIEARVTALAKRQAEVTVPALKFPIPSSVSSRHERNRSNGFCWRCLQWPVGDGNVVRKGAPGTGSEDFFFMDREGAGVLRHYR